MTSRLSSCLISQLIFVSRKKTDNKGGKLKKAMDKGRMRKESGENCRRGEKHDEKRKKERLRERESCIII